MLLGFPGGSDSKASACNVGDPVRFLGLEDPLEKETATHSSVLAWEIPWTEESGGLHSMGWQKGWTQLGDLTATTQTRHQTPQLQGSLHHHLSSDARQKSKLSPVLLTKWLYQRFPPSLFWV